MTEVFRFRTTDKLVGEFQELEEQAIYFADAEELNDPAEGFRDLYWQGDQIVWTNLFRHYISCLNAIFILFGISGATSRISSRDIPAMGNDSTSSELKSLLADVYDRVFESLRLHDFVAALAESQHKCWHEELLFYLQCLHYHSLQAIHQAHVDGNLAAGVHEWDQLPRTFDLAHNFLSQSLDVEEDAVRRELFQMSSWIRNNAFLGAKLAGKIASGTESEANQEFLVCDFPRHYLKQLERLLYPAWYVACFTYDCSNPSMWTHYGDSHKGVCLIFEADESDGSQFLRLQQASDSARPSRRKEFVQRQFLDVRYGDKAQEVDFFQSMGRVPEPQLRARWYSDDKGNWSSCGNHLNGDTGAWRDGYWERFYPPLHIKASDWEYEKETRLIHYSQFGDLPKQHRQLKDDFASLRGIIFGINTPDAEKLKIIEIIREKCRKHDRGDFKFFQAYYCRDSGKIKKY